MDLKRSIEVCCAKRQVSRVRLAEMLGVLPPRISQIKSTNTCTTGTLKKLAKAFDMKASEFIAEGEQ